MICQSICVALLLPVVQSAREGVDARLAAGPTNALARFTDYPSGAAKDRFTHNPKFWAKDVDFSCVSPWNSASGRLRAGTLISKRHVIFAKHYPLAAGTRMSFVDADGNVCPCRLEKTKPIEKSDIMIGSLNYEVTPDIHPAKILPPDYEKFIGRGEGLPVVTFNQHEQLFLNELNAIPTNGSPWRTMSARAPANGCWQAFRSPLIVGDSGDPAFLLIGREPILLYCLTGGGAGSGPGVHLYRREIQAAMDELCPGYKLEEQSLEGLGGLEGSCGEASPAPPLTPELN